MSVGGIKGKRKESDTRRGAWKGGRGGRMVGMLAPATPWLTLGI